MKQKHKSVVMAEFLLEEIDDALRKGNWPFVESPKEVIKRIVNLLDGHYPADQVNSMCAGLERALFKYCDVVRVA